MRKILCIFMCCILLFCSVFSVSAISVDDLRPDYADQSILNIDNSSQTIRGCTVSITNNTVHVTGANDSTIFFTFNIDEITLNGQHYYVIVNCDNLDIQGYLSFGTTDSRVMFFEDGLYPVDFSTDTVVNKFVVRVLAGTHDFSFDFSLVSEEVIVPTVETTIQPTTAPITVAPTTIEPTTENITEPITEPLNGEIQIGDYLLMITVMLIFFCGLFLILKFGGRW